METPLKSKRNNLWYALLLVFLGGLSLRLAFYFEQRVAAAIAVVLGAIMIIVALIIFWRNFSE